MNQIDEKQKKETLSILKKAKKLVEDKWHTISIEIPLPNEEPYIPAIQWLEDKFYRVISVDIWGSWKHPPYHSVVEVTMSDLGNYSDPSIVAIVGDDNKNQK